MSEPTDNFDTRTSEEVKIHLAEYSSLRSEIEILLKDSNQYEYVSVILSVGVITAIGVSFQGQDKTISLPISLVSILLYSVLLWLSVEKHLKIFNAADYIDVVVRPRLSELVGRQVMDWERFKVSGRNSCRR